MNKRIVMFVEMPFASDYLKYSSLEFKTVVLTLIELN